MHSAALVKYVWLGEYSVVENMVSGLEMLMTTLWGDRQTDQSLKYFTTGFATIIFF